MKFWIVSFVNEKGVKEIKYLAADEACDKKKIKKDIRSVYLNIRGLTLKKGKKPHDWVLFEKKLN